MAEYEQSEREQALRKYFNLKVQSTLNENAGCALMLAVAAGIFGMVAGLAEVFLLGLGLGVVGLIMFFTGAPEIISDSQVDEWLQDGIDKLLSESLYRLGLTERDVVGEPLIIRGPILWETHGIDNEDLVYKTGEDDFIRFGVYGVTIIQLTERHLGAYSCDYNFLKDVALNTETDEFHYQDIVSVSTKEQDSSYTLPSGQKLTSVQTFRLTVSSGDKVEVAIGANKISEVTGSDRIPETGAEKAVSVIRTMLREKKA